MKKIRILFLDHTPFIGGAQLSLLQHVEHLDQQEFHIQLACSREAVQTGLVEYYQERGVDYTVIPFSKLKKWDPVVFFRLRRSVKAVRDLIRKEEYDLVVTNTVRSAIIGALAGKKEKKKVVWFIRDFTFPISLFRFFSKTPHRIIFNSKATFQYYRNSLEKGAKAEVVYIGRDFYKRVKDHSSRDILHTRQELGVSSYDTKIIGCTSRLVEWKGVDTLMEAIKELKERGVTNIKCVIMGTGRGQQKSIEQLLKQKVQEWGLKDYMVFTGHKKDVARYLLSFDIFVLPSKQDEPFSSAVVDAMMAGLPVVGTNIGGTPEMIDHNINGLLISPADHIQLADALEELVKNQEFRETISKNGYEYAYHNLRVDITTEKIEAIYKEVMSS